MNDNMLERAKANLVLSKQILQLSQDDQWQINFAAYHLEQSVEFAIKFELLMNGIEFSKTHDIENLIKVGVDNGVKLFCGEYIEDHAEMLSKWEASSRYIVGYFIEYKKVEKTLAYVEEYLKRLSNEY